MCIRDSIHTKGAGFAIHAVISGLSLSGRNTIDETRWLTQKAMAEVFGIDKSGISRHLAKILRSVSIDYVKWDMNRELSDLGSSYLDKGSQQELFRCV